MHEQFYIGLTVLQMPLFLFYDKDYLQAVISDILIFHIQIHNKISDAV